MMLVEFKYKDSVCASIYQRYNWKDSRTNLYLGTFSYRQTILYFYIIVFDTATKKTLAYFSTQSTTK